MSHAIHNGHYPKNSTTGQMWIQILTNPQQMADIKQQLKDIDSIQGATEKRTMTKQIFQKGCNVSHSTKFSAITKFACFLRNITCR